MKLPSDADRSGRDLGSEELELLREVIESGTLNCTKGTQVNRFEQEFAEAIGTQYARAVTSGTAAVHAAIVAVDPEPGDEIVTTPVTDMGAITPILYQQAIPIFADVDPVTLNITPSSVEERITSRTRAIIATHLFGNPCDVTSIKHIADRHGIPVIEDCAQAFLAQQDGRIVGTIGDIACFSLQQGKHMTTGEGGVVVTSNDKFARRVRLFSDKAWGYGDPEPDHYFLALNYRMTELQGAVARAQLKKLPGVVERRRDSACRLTEALRGVRGLTLPAAAPGSSHVYWKYPLCVDPDLAGDGTDALGQALKERGIFCAPRYIQKPAFMCRVLAERATYGRSRCPFSCHVRDGLPPVDYSPSSYPGAIEGLRRVVVLPWNEAYTQEHVAFIGDAIRAAMESLLNRYRN
ncbi:MAG: DegT/DnrJ/EryC1/StrS family aminotransferase [Candidatus Dadabacteria bacterium]|nr:MAG: DegT/DnrJ/EryC1/StrS family aminotransferase [Candidatus Dadabacteria bacterium]